MKASIKFRDEQKPLVRAKIPLNVLSFPFQSGIVAGESKELSLNLSTFFDAGPAFKIAYRPNDSQNPFSLICKIGIGNFGSPISSPFTMSAEFNFVGSQNQNPSFFIHFKPKFGDFSIKKSHSSMALVKKVEPKLNAAVGNGEEAPPLVKHGYFEESGLFSGEEKIGVLPAESAAAATGIANSMMSGMAVNATTAFPLRSRAVLNFRWGLRFPSAAASDGVDAAVLIGKNVRTAGISFKNVPMLVMDKISIEHVAKKDSKDSKTGSGLNLAGSDDVAGVCLDVRKQLEIIQAENGLLRKALHDLRSDIAAGKMNISLSDGSGGRGGSGRGVEGRDGNKFDRRGNGGDRKQSELNGKSMEGDVNEELMKKTFVGATVV
ncbi:uncharacterized protein [Coffea arabica]|uniref:Uncharacterized protein n=1 Tax=Coffea arabica TaxID=13443 RepID=A0ABM4UW28_COFAR|nr:uncharacterized protein LOC113696431 [Coffea arabica]